MFKATLTAMAPPTLPRLSICSNPRGGGEGGGGAIMAQKLSAAHLISSFAPSLPRMGIGSLPPHSFVGRLSWVWQG